MFTDKSNSLAKLTPEEVEALKAAIKLLEGFPAMADLLRGLVRDMLPPEPVKWEPPPGQWRINWRGEALELAYSHTEARELGLERTSRALAERDGALINRYRRLLAYVTAEAPEHDPSGTGFSIYRNASGEVCQMIGSINPDFGEITMPKAVAAELSRKINEEEIDL